ncbi:MAG: hypothetical protein WCT77_12325 [Bacteroidota bacterium]
MKNKINIMMLIASVLVAGAFIFPIWSISLTAPQYPEGLGLYIFVNKIDGHKPNDVQSINGLNHYIGMKQIHPDDIQELKIMPYFIGFMIVFGLLAGFINQRKLIAGWVFIFLGAAIYGMYDFWQWEYDYGHNLDPKAIIKIPGMSYQPPLIGSKQLLNFNAVSLPAPGAVFIGVAIILAVISFLMVKKFNTCNHLDKFKVK